MHKIIASTYSAILNVLNIIIILAFASYIYTAFQSFQYAPNQVLFAILAFLVYIVVVGLFSVIISMHQNITEINDNLQKLLLEKQTTISNVDANEPYTLTDRKEPKI
jgi:predicted PurR-regulated permease PerM